MIRKSQGFVKLFTFQKYVGIFCIAIGIPLFLLNPYQASEMLLLIGLFMLFTAPQKIEDERSLSLKTSSLYFSFILVYVLRIISSTLFSYNLFPIEMITINHFMILVFSLSLIIYYSRFYSFKVINKE